jgi:hypothetical protein
MDDRLLLMRRCPSFGVCSAPKCPLDPDAKKRVKFGVDEECRAWKTSRTRVVEEARAEGGQAAAVAAELPGGGLTPQEAAGKRAWDRLSEEEKARRRDRLAAQREAMQEV